MAEPMDFPIYWESHLVGWVRQRVYDMHFTYGRWEPAKTSHADRFLEQLNLGKEQKIRLGESELGVVCYPPKDGEVCVNLWPK